MRCRCARRGRNQLLVFPGKAIAFNSNPPPVRPWRVLLKVRSSRARAKKLLARRAPDWPIRACTIPARSAARVRLARTELDAFPDKHRQWHRQGKPGQKNDQHQGSHALTMSARAAKFRDGTNTSIRNVSREPDSRARSGGPSRPKLRRRRFQKAAGLEKWIASQKRAATTASTMQMESHCTGPLRLAPHHRRCLCSASVSSGGSSVITCAQIPSLARWLECPAIGHKRQIPG